MYAIAIQKSVGGNIKMRKKKHTPTHILYIWWIFAIRDNEQYKPSSCAFFSISKPFSRKWCVFFSLQTRNSLRTEFETDIWIVSSVIKKAVKAHFNGSIIFFFFKPNGKQFWSTSHMGIKTVKKTQQHTLSCSYADWYEWPIMFFSTYV